MTNWNLSSFNNIYASLAQSAYRDRPIRFVYEQLSKSQLKRLDSGQSVRFNFSQDVKKGGQVTQGVS